MKKVIPFTKTMTFKTMIAEITDIEVKHDLCLNDNSEIEGDILVDGTYKMTDASQIEEEFHYKLPFVINIDDRYVLDDINITIGDFYFEIINEEDLKINVEIDIDGLVEKEKVIEVVEHQIKFDDNSNHDLIDVEKLEEIEDSFVRNDDSMKIPVEINQVVEKLEVDATLENPLDKLEKEIKEDLNVKKEMNYYINNATNNEEVEKEEVAVVAPSNAGMGSIFNFISTEETFSTYYVYIVRESDTLDGIIEKYKTTKEQVGNYNDISDIKIGSKLIIPCQVNE